MDYESKESRYQLLVRKWFYERGFHNCYIARASDTNEMCNIRWMITSQDIREAGFENRLPKLKEDEVLLENVYTLERFRGRGTQAASYRHMTEIARKQGFRRVIAYVAEDNIPVLRLSMRRGYQVFEKVSERRILFHVTRETIQQMSTPVAIPIPQERQGADPK